MTCVCYGLLPCDCALPEIGAFLTHCRRDTSLSFTQTFSQLIYSKSTGFYIAYLQQIHNFAVVTSFVISFFLARLYKMLYASCIIQTAAFEMKGGHYTKESVVLEQQRTVSDMCRWESYRQCFREDAGDSLANLFAT